MSVKRQGSSATSKLEDSKSIVEVMNGLPQFKNFASGETASDVSTDEEMQGVSAEDMPVEDEISDEDDTDIPDSGAYDLNFAEFPIAHLTQRLPAWADKHKIEYYDTIVGQDNKPVKRKWIIKSSADHGLGGPASIAVLFEILQMWKEQNFEKDKVYIGTYYNLLKRLDWSMSGQSYKQLIRELESLYGLEITAENAFYDKEKNKYVDKKYKPFIGWGIWKENERDKSLDDYGYIQVHPDFHALFKQKSMYFVPFSGSTLKNFTPTEQKLAFYLSKVFNPYRKRVVSKYTRNIYTLCAQLPILGTREKQKYYLTKAAAGLIQKRFVLLESYNINKENIIFYNKLQTSLLPYLNMNSGKSKPGVAYMVEEIMKVCGDEKSLSFYEIVAKNVPDDIIYQCLAEAKVDGEDPSRLFTYLIKLKGKEYLENILH